MADTKYWNAYYESLDQSDLNDLLIIQVEADTEDEAITKAHERFIAIVLIHSNWSFTEIREGS
jgi:hypothetical protein